MSELSRVDAILALDAAEVEYTVRLPAAEASRVWRALVQPVEQTLIDLIDAHPPTLKMRAGNPQPARIDYAISRDSINRIWLQIGVICTGADVEEMQTWRERTLRLLAEHGAQTISAGYDEAEFSLTIVGGTWP